MAVRLLVISDIHNHAGVVARLVRQEAGTGYDAVLVAGDLGAETARADLTALRTLAPVYYVYGNWERTLPYPLDGVPEGCTQVHLDLHDLGNSWYLSGYSGCVSGWGHENPLARSWPATPRGQAARRKSELLAAHNNRLEHVVRNINGRRLILMTHERLSHLARYGTDQTGPAVHLHGHLHRYRHTERDRRHIVDVAGLDDRLPQDGGGYCVLELDGERVRVERRMLASAPFRTPAPGQTPWQ